MLEKMDVDGEEEEEDDEEGEEDVEDKATMAEGLT